MAAGSSVNRNWQRRKLHFQHCAEEFACHSPARECPCCPLARHCPLPSGSSRQRVGQCQPLCDDSQVSIFQVSGADPALSISVHPLIMHTFPWGPSGTLSQQPLGSAVPATHRDPLGVPESSYRWQRKCAKPQKSSSLGSPELQAPTHCPPPALS